MLYEQLSRLVDTRDPSVFTIDQIHGGTTPNVIPDHVKISGLLCCTDYDVRRYLHREIRKMCTLAGALTRNIIAVDFRYPLGAVRKPIPVTTRDVLENNCVIELIRPSIGGEDFSVYLDYAPGSSAASRLCRRPFLHSPLFDMDERVITLAAGIVAQTALQLDGG